MSARKMSLPSGTKIERGELADNVEVERSTSRNMGLVRLAGGWWLLLICCERKIMLASWWLVLK
jgi:hypothetical protein